MNFSNKSDYLFYHFNSQSIFNNNYLCNKQIARSNSNKSDSKKSTNDSSSSSPDITSRGPLCSNNNNNNHSQSHSNHHSNHHSNNINNNLNNNGNGPLTATMSETSDDSSLNSVELDPMGKAKTILNHIQICVLSDFFCRSFCNVMHALDVVDNG